LAVRKAAAWLATVTVILTRTAGLSRAEEPDPAPRVSIAGVVMGLCPVAGWTGQPWLLTPCSTSRPPLVFIGDASQLRFGDALCHDPTDWSPMEPGHESEPLRVIACDGLLAPHVVPPAILVQHR